MKYQLHHKFLINQSFKVEDQEDTEYQFGWKIINPKKSFVVFTKDLNEKLEWLRDLKNCIQRPHDTLTKNAYSSSMVAFKWQPDTQSESCNGCNERFTVLNRRHHCRNCGKLICVDCSLTRLLLPHSQVKKERVCDQCALAFAISDTNDQLTIKNSLEKRISIQLIAKKLGYSVGLIQKYIDSEQKYQKIANETEIKITTTATTTSAAEEAKKAATMSTNRGKIKQQAPQRGHLKSRYHFQRPQVMPYQSISKEKNVQSLQAPKIARSLQPIPILRKVKKKKHTVAFSAPATYLIPPPSPCLRPSTSYLDPPPMSLPPTTPLFEQHVPDVSLSRSVENGLFISNNPSPSPILKLMGRKESPCGQDALKFAQLHNSARSSNPTSGH